MNVLFDKTFAGLERSLELRFKRHTLLTGNIANSETPKFRARELDFAGELNRVLGATQTEIRRTDNKHLDGQYDSTAHVVFDDSGTARADGNNVDLDLEMGKIAENQRMFQGSVTMLDLKLRMLKQLVSGRAGG